jgi:hypothetical protein
MQMKQATKNIRIHHTLPWWWNQNKSFQNNLCLFHLIKERVLTRRFYSLNHYLKQELARVARGSFLMNKTRLKLRLGASLIRVLYEQVKPR